GDMAGGGDSPEPSFALTLAHAPSLPGETCISTPLCPQIEVGLDQSAERSYGFGRVFAADDEGDLFVFGRGEHQHAQEALAVDALSIFFYLHLGAISVGQLDKGRRRAH